jgi:four helix bundle protein
VTFVDVLPKSPVFQELGGQLLSSGTSAEANYRAAKRARSAAEFVAKLKIVEEEADESVLWIDRIRTARLPAALHADADRLRDMFDQIVAMTVESIKTTKARHLKPRASARRRQGS